MSIFIHDEDIVDYFAAVEGDAYTDDPYSCFYGPHGLDVGRKKLREFDESREARIQEDGYTPEELDKKGVHIIYGLGGINRYAVRGDGRVEFSSRHASEEAVERAISAGFDVY